MTVLSISFISWDMSDSFCSLLSECACGYRSSKLNEKGRTQISVPTLNSLSQVILSSEANRRGRGLLRHHFHSCLPLMEAWATGLCLLWWCLNKTKSEVSVWPSSLFRATPAPGQIHQALGASSFDTTAQTQNLSLFFLTVAIRHNSSGCLPLCHLPVLSLPPFAPDLGNTAGLNDTWNPSSLDLTEEEAFRRTSSFATTGHTAASAESRFNKCDFRLFSCGEKLKIP